MKQIDRPRTSIKEAQQVEENVRYSWSGGNFARAGYLKCRREEKSHLEPIQLRESSWAHLAPELLDLTNIVGARDHGPVCSGTHGGRVSGPKPARQVAELSIRPLERQPPDEPRCHRIRLGMSDGAGQERSCHGFQIIRVF